MLISKTLWNKIIIMKSQNQNPKSRIITNLYGEFSRDKFSGKIKILLPENCKESFLMKLTIFCSKKIPIPKSKPFGILKFGFP